jgi:type IV pilus assembly protein PilO
MAMQMDELIERFSKIPNTQKYGGLAIFLALISALFYFMFYSDMEVQAKRLKQQRQILEGEKTKYLDMKQKYMSFRAEVKKLLQEKKELVKVLPTSAEIPALLQTLHAQAELAGLNILTFQMQGEQRRGFYAVIPVRMVIDGNYHLITKFFHSVGNLKRIVNVQNVLLAKVGKLVPGKPIPLRASFVASTFRFVDQ